jgi:uncharacterized phiE125 gp8 family phage protein
MLQLYTGTLPRPAPILITPPAVLPVSLEDARRHLRVDATDEDFYIDGLIRAAVAYLDGWNGILAKCLINQTWSQSFTSLSDPLRLALRPVSSITSIGHGDDSPQEALDPLTYQLTTDSIGAKVVAVSGAWPSLDDVTITYVAGYGAAANDVPGNIRHAILLIVGAMFENREDPKIPDAVYMLLRPYKDVIA